MSTRSSSAPFLLLITLLAICDRGSTAPSDPLEEAQKSLENYMLCGVDYVGATAGATVAGAEIKCATLLDAYASALRTAAARAALAKGKSPADTQTYAIGYAKKAGAKASDAFDSRIRQLLEQGRHRQ